MLMYLSFDLLSSIKTLLYQMAILKWITLLLGSQTVTFMVLLFWISFFITTVFCRLPTCIFFCIFDRLLHEKSYYLETFQYLRKFLLFIFTKQVENIQYLFISNWWIVFSKHLYSLILRQYNIQKLIACVNIGKWSGAAKLVFQWIQSFPCEYY